MKRVLWVAIGFILALGGLLVATRYYAVDDEQIPRLSRAQRAREMCPDASDEAYYYPSDLFDPRHIDTDSQVRRFYSELILPTMGERPLWCGEVQGDTFRLINVGTHVGWISVRVSRAGRAATLSVVVLEGNLGPGMSPRRTQRPLSDAEWQGIVRLVDGGNIWNIEDRGLGTAGYDWILELRRGPTYHLVRGGGRGGAFGDVARRLMGLAGVGY